MNGDTLDWAALDRLRARFLDASAAHEPYWQSTGDLEAYDQTYAERIGWKWDAVLSELKLRGWSPQSGADAAREDVSRPRIVDWGCGSGVAGRRVVRAWGTDAWASLSVWDHSPLAREFALAKAQAAFPTLPVRIWDRAAGSVDLLVVSHVLNELTSAAAAELRACIEQAVTVIWVEPGTSVVARQLQTWRDELHARFRVVAPCPHQAACGLNTPERERDWCHHFAPPPAGVYADRDWVRFGQRAGVDLRSLPYSFLVLDRRAHEAVEPTSLPQARVVGRPEIFKPYARVLNCDASGVNTLEVPKRTQSRLLKHLDRTKAPLLYRWRHVDGQVMEGAPEFPDQ